MKKPSKPPNLASRGQSQKGSSIMKPNNTQSQKAKRVSKYRVSEEEAEKFKSKFPPELIIKLIN